ncbi:MAG TPA: hypothetical protein VG347_10350 [Verrucomicrobiae bacterium]|nr:hypothetical protein [Verrucomicrobiae bacterium]
MNTRAGRARSFRKMKGTGEEGTGAFVVAFKNFYILRNYQTISPLRIQRRKRDDWVTISRHRDLIRRNTVILIYKPGDVAETGSG